MTAATTKAVRGARPEAIWEKKGGQAVSGLGGAILVVGLIAAALAALTLQWLFPAGIAGYVVAAALTLLTLPLGLGFRHAGKKLSAEGLAREKAATLATIDQLAQASGTGVTADELARLGGIDEARADAILTSLAESGDLRLEVSDEGDLLYYPKVQRLRASEDVASIARREPSADELLADEADPGAIRDTQRR